MHCLSVCHPFVKVCFLKCVCVGRCAQVYSHACLHLMRVCVQAFVLLFRRVCVNVRGYSVYSTLTAADV